MSGGPQFPEQRLRPDDGSIDWLYSKYGVHTTPDPWDPYAGRPEADITDVQRAVLLLWPEPDCRYEATQLLLGERLPVDGIKADPKLVKLLEIEDVYSAGSQILFYGFERACAGTDDVLIDYGRVLKRE